MSDKKIYSQYNSLISGSDKEKKLNQKAKVIWLTGLSGAGKSTIGIGLEIKLFKKGFFVQLLDGDIIRLGINKDLGYSEADRFENIRRIAEVSKLFIDAGVITINCFISPTEEIRNLAKNIIGPENFIEIFVNTPIEICEQRDAKGLYKKARQGLIKDFTGVSSIYETPVDPDFIVTTHDKTIEESVKKVYDFVVGKLRL